MKATLNFKHHEMANLFAVQWSRLTLMGHTVSAQRPDGGATVEVYNVTPELRWVIDDYVERLNSD